MADKLSTEWKGCGGMELEVVCGYEGSNPQEPDRIIHLAEDTVRVCPESEDGDSNYKFAFDIMVKNRADAPRPLNLDIDWQEPPEVGTRYMSCRDAVFVQHSGSNLQEMHGQLARDHVHLTLRIPPGTSRIGLHPPFGTPELEAFFEQAQALEGAKRVTFGQTAAGRPLEAAVLPALDRAEDCLLGVGRFHPYETAGSYVIWGTLDLLAGRKGTGLRERRTFILVPMANPDGAANGLCKRTAWGGVNLSEEGNNSNDPTACSLRGLIAGIAASTQRGILFDAHGWMNREEGLWVYRPELEQPLLAQLGRDLFPNGWRSYVRSGEDQDPSTADLRGYAGLTLGMETVVTSSPWFGRLPEQMREVGAVMTEAILNVLQ
jgi:hypothetical protein